jgi:hypothetical protein
MLVVIDKGFIYSAVVSKEDPAELAVRSQDLDSIRYLSGWLEGNYKREFKIVKTVQRDYEFRITILRTEWAAFLEGAVHDAVATNVKNEVGRRRGHSHPVYKALELVFYHMAENRPDGTLPGFLSYGKRRGA